LNKKPKKGSRVPPLPYVCIVAKRLNGSSLLSV